MSARTTRTRLLAAATAALAALALTACEKGSDTRAGDAPSATVAANDPTAAPPARTETGTGAGASPSAPAEGGGTGPTASGAHGSAAPGTGGSGTAGGSASGSGGDGDGKGSGRGDGRRDGEHGTATGTGLPADCSAATVRITATVVSRPVNHLLLTATGTGGASCMLPPHPEARFGGAQSVPPVVQESQARAVRVLDPGRSGYAGVRLSSGDGSAANGHRVTTLTVPFDDGSAARVTLPGGGVYVDDALAVTYWQPGLDSALEY
ncbi:DUF4232 domain-containing protein [Streptomyces sp. SID8352]|uniref:DUF4232 domain-containing protein n=1 Tax=Streptomyces sp. SID8352 TaxID=2690338 RepID=UPI00136BF01B|nr:DUF4232 domain-containing protein [Streptomyces sp. SID8352]MYU23738.1 DUF4232 domain-containing protein [Streptomyces sp. SID8352]